MGEVTEISWTDHTYSPWWGCQRVSPGCGLGKSVGGCYAEAWAKRTGHVVWGPTAPRRFFGDKHWHEPVKWNARAERERVPHRVFCASMCDVFEDRPDLREPRARLFRLIEATPWLRWQLLTKRPENMVRLARDEGWFGDWPRTVWAGTTVEDRARTTRIDVLRSVPAAVRFLSAEPLLEDLGELDLRGIHQVIVGGESGPGSRPFAFEWAERIRVQCGEDANTGLAFFMKQGGAHPTFEGELVQLRDRRKGADITELPAGLRVREFPQ